MRKARRAQEQRYSAMLLFQFRVVTRGKSNQRRLCERRLIVFTAANAEAAFDHASRYGIEAQHNYPNDSGDMVHFEFVGIADLLKIGLECEADEVWYDLDYLTKPKERRRQLLPRKSSLPAFVNNQKSQVPRRNRRARP